MDDLKNSPIFELSKLAERCTIGYETLYHQTKLNFTAQNYCSLDLYDHASDADDEITDLSGECHDSSSELKFTPKEYLICNGSKPLSFIIRRCDIDSQSQPSFKLSKTSKVLSYGSDIIENKCQLQESSYESHVESSTPEVIDNTLKSDSSDKHEKISSPQESHLNIDEVCINDVQNDGDALFGIYNNQESMSLPLINHKTSIVSYENKSLLCSVENSEENFRNNSNLEQQFPSLAINLDDNYKERAYVSTCEKMNATAIETVRMGNNVLIDEVTTELQVKNGSSLKPQGVTVGLDANFSQTYNIANPNDHVTEECVNNNKVKSNNSILNLASVQEKKDRGYDGKYSGAGTSNDNLMPLGKLGKCLVKNNDFEFHCNSSNILLDGIEVHSGFYNEETVRKSKMKNLSSQLLSNEINHVDCRKNVNKYDTQNTYKEIMNSKKNVSNGKFIYTNKLSLIQNEACIHNDVEETCLNENINSGKAETSSPTIHSEYFMQTDLCHNSEPLSSSEELSKESQEKSSDNRHSQNSCDVKRSSNTEEYLLMDNDSTTTKGTDKTIVNVAENTTDTMSPVLTVPAEHFASFEKVYDNMYNQNSQTVAEKLVPQSNNNDDRDCRYSLDDMNMIEASGNITASDFQSDINSEDIEKSSLEVFENETRMSPIRSNGKILNSEVYENDTKIVSVEESDKTNLKMFVIQPCESPLKMETSVNLPSVQESNTDNQNVSAVEEHLKDSYLNNDDLTTQSSISLSPKNPIRTIGMDETENPAEIIINDQYLPVNMETESNIMEEDTTDFAERQTSSVLLDELTESRTSFTNTDSTSDQFSKHDKVHNSSFMAQTFTEDAMDCPYTEDTVFLQHSPLLFSSDDENSYCTVTDIINNQEKEEPKKPNNFNEILTQEQKKLHQLQEALVGVPPPPSVTIPQIDVTEILKLLKENEKLMISAASKNNMDTEAAEIKKTTFLPSSNDHIKNISWPESKSYCYYDIQFNHGKVSEEFESLCQKLRERYVGCETTSSCTIWFTREISNKISSMTNKGKNFGRSPGRRLSHLARRRQTFSSANLLNNGVGQLPGILPSTTSERRPLMVEVKKNDRRQKSKNVRPQKEVPSADTNKLQQTKRALFKSPPNIHKRVPSASKSRSGSKKDRSNVDKHKIQNSKRALWPAASNDNNKSRIGHDRALTNISGHINVYGKRKRDDSDVVMQSNKCSRRLLFSDSPKRKTDCSHDKNHKGNNNGENGLQVSSCARSSHKNTSAVLSERHRKKLLWAIAEALRVEGISMSHESFRPCASMLGYLVRSLLPDLKCKREGSTSDLMLKLSKQHVKDIIKKYQTAGSNKVCKT